MEKIKFNHNEKSVSSALGFKDLAEITANVSEITATFLSVSLQNFEEDGDTQELRSIITKKIEENITEKQKLALIFVIASSQGAKTVISLLCPHGNSVSESIEHIYNSLGIDAYIEILSKVSADFLNSQDQ